MMTSCGASLAATAFRSFATASGCSSAVLSTRMARPAPSASAVRSVSWQAPIPQDTATISVAIPFSLNRTAFSTQISSKGFMDIFTLAVSTPEPSGFTRTLTLKSTTRLTATSTFMGDAGRGALRTCGSANYNRPMPSCRSPRRRSRRRRTLLLAQVSPPGNPVVNVPAFADPSEGVLGHVDVDQLDAAATPLGMERQDECGIEVLPAPVRRAPRLHDEPLRHALQDVPAQRAAQRAGRGA